MADYDAILRALSKSDDNECTVGLCSCRNPIWRPFYNRCRLCSFNANRDIKWVSQEEYNKIVVKSQQLDREYEETVRQAEEAYAAANRARDQARKQAEK